VKKILISISSVISLGLPVFVFAADVDPGYLKSFFTAATNLFQNVVLFLISLAVAWFIWNVIRYVMSEGDEGKENAKKQMVWGIIAITVIMSVWGLVAILQKIFGVDGINRVPTGSELNFIPGVNSNQSAPSTPSDAEIDAVFNR
jgi:succinate dehydrogenase/fumarate reductase cytochrome b subunit